VRKALGLDPVQIEMFGMPEMLEDEAALADPDVTSEA
jgi:hypothetical protein